MPITDRVTVVGAGQMGLGIAHGFAVAGHAVTLVDVSDSLLHKAQAAILSIVDEGVARGKMPAGARTEVAARLSLSADLATAVREAALVIETATENIRVKLDILQTAAAAAPEQAVIASNTSALSITELAASVPRPERVIGMHFFNPVHKMKLCEVIRGLQTSDETVARTRAWAEGIGKTHILVNESPGFTTSRISALLGNEAMWMLSEGVASAEDIDTSLRLAFNHPMGPLELGDLTGWDTRLSVLTYLHQTLGEKFRPCPLMIKMVQAGRHGRKVGHGVYRYENGQKVAGVGAESMVSRHAVIVDAVRTPIGRFRGALASVRADHLGAVVLQGLTRRNDLDPALVGDVVFGCVTQIGEQSANIARTALLSAGWPDSVPGLTIDRKCGSSEVALHVAQGMIAAGQARIVVAGGAEAMSRVPMGSNRDLHGEPFGHKWLDRYELTSQGEGAERICERWGLTREALDDYAFESHRRAALAADAGYFDSQIAPVDTGIWGEDMGNPAVVSADQTIRRDTTRAKLATLKPSFRPEGRVTAGNASQISDGAAALLVMDEETAQSLGLRPRARIVQAVTVGSDPVLMLTGPVAATRTALDRAGLTIDDIDLFEVNEAFAPVPLMWLAETGADPARLNVDGGAIALGHPLGGSGARLLTSLLHALERRGARYGLQSMCCAGGLGTATIIERL